jgi:Domain of unknown function (DUF4105)
MFAGARRVFFVILFFLKASPVWGFSFSSERTEQYIQKALQLNLAYHPKWIKLGHYEKSFLENYKSAFSRGFLLDDKGFKDPQAELVTTIRAIYSNSEEISSKLKHHPQCYYLARARWLNKVLSVAPEDILPCEERQNWKKQLGVTKVSLIFASSDIGNASSSFGHTFLKLINPANAKNKDLIDYGVDYAADADPNEGIFYAVKGLVGQYSGRFTMLPYHQKIREYLNLEGRDIWEYHLNFSAEETEELVDHLLEMENARAPYYFFNDNCSYRILKSLETVRPETDLADQFKYFVIPIDTVKKIFSATNWVSEVKFKKSLKSDYIESYGTLSEFEKNELRYLVVHHKWREPQRTQQIEKAKILETAQKFFSLKSYQTGKAFDEVKYNLSVERAMLGPVLLETQKHRKEEPHQSHDSSALYWGSLYNSNTQNTEMTLKFRNALHDLEQIDYGTVRFSQIEMASIEIKTNNSKTEKWSLKEFKFLDLINLSPISDLDRPMSWKFKAALQDNWDHDIEGAVGLSRDFQMLGLSRWGYFFTGRKQEVNDEQIDQLGPEILVIYRPLEKVGLSVSGAYFLVNKYKDQVRFQAKLNYNINKKWDLQFSHLNEAFSVKTTEAKLVYNFIL